MEWAKKWEWGGFAFGISLALMLWTTFHAGERAHTADSLATISEESTGWAESAGITGLDKPAGRANDKIKQTRAKSDRDSGRSNAVAAADSASTSADAETDRTQPNISVRVYLTEQRLIETVPLETYVRGVVAAEMPPAFEPAALEAQAMAARTYIIRRLLDHDHSNMPVSDADVTDTVAHQAYRSLDDMNRLHAENEQAWRKADEAAGNTKGKVITYGGKPIQALYFSASNGYTENSENIFPFELPYLRSVASPWDRRQKTPAASETVELPISEFYAKLGVQTLPAGVALNNRPKIRVTGWTDGRQIKSLSVGDKSFTGPEIRELLNLRSASFTWWFSEGTIHITTYGNGHGVGMSQWGAEGMAEAGYTAEEIVKHYYTGTDIMEVSKLAQTVVDSP